MKNFELYIDEIATDYAELVPNCWIADKNGGQCFDVRVPCAECFKKWALQEAPDSIKQQVQPNSALFIHAIEAMGSK
jgi:hypothetical protein